MSGADQNWERYSRQLLFSPIGIAGQVRLSQSRVVVIGCGALGASSAEMLARAGVGFLRLIDRDVLEPSNLGRQATYTAVDAQEGRPKASALAAHLLAYNPTIAVEPRVCHLDSQCVDELLAGFDLYLDATDNFETRYLVNDFAIRERKPWIYGACVAARGLTSVILPGETPCLRCLFPDPPPPGTSETCDTTGIIAPAATIVAGIQVAEALKLLVGAKEAVRRSLLSIELWPFRILEVGGADGPSPECPACGRGEFPFLDRSLRRRASVACGRNAVQLMPQSGAPSIDLAGLELRLRETYPCRRQDCVLRVEVKPFVLTVFDDGRVLVVGTSDPERARVLHDQVIGC